MRLRGWLYGLGSKLMGSKLLGGLLYDSRSRLLHGRNRRGGGMCHSRLLRGIDRNSTLDSRLDRDRTLGFCSGLLQDRSSQV